MRLMRVIYMVESIDAHARGLKHLNVRDRDRSVV